MKGLPSRHPENETTYFLIYNLQKPCIEQVLELFGNSVNISLKAEKALALMHRPYSVTIYIFTLLLGDALTDKPSWIYSLLSLVWDV